VDVERTNTTRGGAVVDLLNGLEVEVLLGGIDVGCVDSGARAPVVSGATVDVERTNTASSRAVVDLLDRLKVEIFLRRVNVRGVHTRARSPELLRAAVERTNTTSGRAVVELLDRVQVGVTVRSVDVGGIDAVVRSIVGTGRSRSTVVRTTVDVLVLQVDGVAVLVLLVDIGVDVNSGGHVEALALIIAGGAAEGSAAVGMVRSVATLVATPAVVHILVLEVNGVVILVLLIDGGVHVNGSGHVEALALIIARRSTESGATVGRSEATLPTPVGAVVVVNVGVLQVDGVVISVGLVHIGLDVCGVGLAEGDAIIVTRGATESGATIGVVRSFSSVVRTTARTAEGSATLLGVPALRVAPTRVNVSVLLLNRVVILVEVVDIGVDDCSKGHVELLATIIARRTTEGGTAGASTLSEGTHSRYLRTVEHSGGVAVGELILVLDVDGVVVLAPLLHLVVGLDIGRVGAHKATVTVLSSGATKRSASNMRGCEAILATLKKLGLCSNCQQCNGNASNETLHRDDSLGINVMGFGCCCP
jgi:hypothetical protein